MDGHRKTRGSLRRLALESLEDRFLLTALPAPIGPSVTAPVALFTQQAEVLPAITGASSYSNPQSVADTGNVPTTKTVAAESASLPGPASAAGKAITTSEGPSPTPSAVVTAFANARTVADEESSDRDDHQDDDDAPSGGDRTADVTSARAGEDRDDDADRRASLRAVAAAEFRAAVVQVLADTDTRANGPPSETDSGSPNLPGEDGDEVPQPAATTTTIAAPAAATPEGMAAARALSEEAMSTLGYPAPPAIPGLTGYGRFIASRPAPAADGSPLEGKHQLDRLLQADEPTAGTTSVDLGQVEIGLESFFARLTNTSTESVGGGPSVSVAAWLATVAAAALEIARVRDRVYRARSASNGTTGLPATPLGDKA
jgi:hypothetical protein